MKKTHIIFYSIVALVTLGFIGVGLLLLNDLPGSTTVHLKSCQPDTISYNSYDPYCAAVLQQGSKYSIFIGRNADDFPSYGHRLHYPHNMIYIQSREEERFEWSEAGVTWYGGLGHILFIPTDGFTRGR